MHHKEESRLDRFAFALGCFAIASPYTVFPVVANDRISAAWDQRLGGKSDKVASGCAARSRVRWAT